MTRTIRTIPGERHVSTSFHIEHHPAIQVLGTNHPEKFVVVEMTMEPFAPPMTSHYFVKGRPSFATHANAEDFINAINA